MWKPDTLLVPTSFLIKTVCEATHYNGGALQKAIAHLSHGMSLDLSRQHIFVLLPNDASFSVKQLRAFAKWEKGEWGEDAYTLGIIWGAYSPRSLPTCTSPNGSAMSYCGLSSVNPKSDLFAHINKTCLSWMFTVAGVETASSSLPF